MKAMLISIKPKWLKMILNGEKTREFRKSKSLYKSTLKLLKEQGYATFFMYCPKESPWICWEKGVAKINNGRGCITTGKSLKNFNGKVVAKFTLRKIDVYEIQIPIYDQHSIYKNNEYHAELETCYNDIVDDGKIPAELVLKYIDKNYELCGTLFGLPIEDVVILDKPKRLCDFRSTKIEYDEIGKPYHPFIKNSPQNYCYVEVEE